MTDVMVGMHTDTALQDTVGAGRVLDVLGRISSGSLESTQEISDVYGDVEVLVERAQAAADRFAELGVEPSPYLLHLLKIKQIEEDVSRM